jgi:hypothetical protein
MILGFKQQFLTAIKNGSKIHTIRLDKNNRWKAGEIAHMATGVRTKNYKCFELKYIVSVQDIEFVWIEKSDIPIIYIDSFEFKKYRCLADNDGFKSVDDFLQWPEWYRKNFKGKIIHWTTNQY